MTDFWAGLADIVQPMVNPEKAGFEGDWREWVREMFPRATSKPFAEHHAELWRWVWEIRLGVRPRPFVGVWSRGGGKSTNTEIAVAAVGALQTRRYCVYVSDTQDQADKRVGDVASHLESESVSAHYPALGQRALSKFGSPKGWRRNRIHTASGLIVDALGLDTAARGLKVEDQRPDFIVFDDIDGRHDSEKITKKKVETIKETIIPMGSNDRAILCVQNLIIPRGFFGQMVSGEADYLADRIVSGPIPAIIGLKTEPREDENGNIISTIIEGEATWEGQSVEDCQNLIIDTGLAAFNREQQHLVENVEGALWKREIIKVISQAPERLKRIAIGVDPSGGTAEIGIVVVAEGYDGLFYVLGDYTQPGRLGPLNWANKVATAFEDHEADIIVAEKNFGGDMVVFTLQAAGGALPIIVTTSSRAKEIRAEPTVLAYQQGRFRHVGSHHELELEMTTWVPSLTGRSPNRLDALVFAANHLLPERKRKRKLRMRPPGV